MHMHSQTYIANHIHLLHYFFSFGSCMLVGLIVFFLWTPPTCFWCLPFPLLAGFALIIEAVRKTFTFVLIQLTYELSCKKVIYLAQMQNTMKFNIDLKRENWFILKINVSLYEKVKAKVLKNTYSQIWIICK